MWVFLELPKMQCACVTLAEKLRGRLTCFVHSQVAIGSERIFIAVIVKWFAFLNKRPQRGRDGHLETRSEPYDETYKYSQPDSYIYSQPATIASLWSEGLLGPTDQIAITFDSVTQFQQQLHFQKDLIITFQMTYNLSGFAEVRILPLFLVMTSLWRHRSCFWKFLFLFR